MRNKNNEAQANFPGSYKKKKSVLQVERAYILPRAKKTGKGREMRGKGSDFDFFVIFVIFLNTYSLVNQTRGLVG